MLWRVCLSDLFLLPFGTSVPGLAAAVGELVPGMCVFAPLQLFVEWQAGLFVSSRLRWLSGIYWIA